MRNLDLRAPVAHLEDALQAPDARLRHLALAGLAHYHTAEVVPALRRALADPEAPLRLLAARALAIHPELTPRARERDLLAALAAEPPGPDRARLVDALAPSLAAAPPWLGADRENLEASCHVLQHLASARRELGPLPERVSHELPSPALTPAIVATCLQALASAAEAGWRPSGAAAEALQPLFRQPDPAFRRPTGLALLGTSTLPWSRVLLDQDPLVRLAAARRSAEPPHPAPLAARLAAVDAQFAEFLDRPERFAQPHLHAFRVLLRGLHAHAQDPGVTRTAARIYQQLGDALPPAPPRVRAGASLVHCEAAELLDLARRWPARVRECGSDALPEDLARAAEVRVLATSDDSHALRAGLLERHLTQSGLHVKLAATHAASTLPDAMRDRLLGLAVAQPEPLVAAAALSELTRSASPDARRAALDPRAKLAAQEPAVAKAWLALVRETGILHPGVTPLASHPSPDVRSTARALLRELGEAVPELRPAVPNALAADRVPPAGATFRLLLNTTAGPVRIALDADHSPVAAVRVANLVRAGHYDHERPAALVPGAHLAFGAPTAPTGLGGWLRHEGPLTTPERGAVALVDQGRDAVTSQLFVALEARPELAGRLAVIGRVSSGMEVLDALTEADRILEARLETR